MEKTIIFKGKKMFKKIINPIEELNYRVDGIDNKYLINDGQKALGLFAATSGVVVPTQISPQDVSFFVVKGEIEISTDDKIFGLKKGDLLLIPKTSAFTISFVENSKILTTRM